MVKTQKKNCFHHRNVRIVVQSELAHRLGHLGKKFSSVEVIFKAKNLLSGVIAALMGISQGAPQDLVFRVNRVWTAEQPKPRVSTGPSRPGTLTSEKLLS